MTKRTAPVGRNSVKIRTTSGMISPAFRTIAVSPKCKSNSARRSLLCSVALETVVPAINTGRSSATGVSVPVRPT